MQGWPCTWRPCKWNSHDLVKPYNFHYDFRTQPPYCITIIQRCLFTVVWQLYQINLRHYYAYNTKVEYVKRLQCMAIYIRHCSNKNGHWEAMVTCYIPTGHQLICSTSKELYMLQCSIYHNIIAITMENTGKLLTINWYIPSFSILDQLQLEALQK